MAALLTAPAWAGASGTADQGRGPGEGSPPGVEQTSPLPPSERNEPVAPPPVDAHGEDEAATQPGTGGAGVEDPVEDREIRRDPNGEGQGGSGTLPGFEPGAEDPNAPSPELVPPTEDPSIMGQEGERDVQGGVFDTGDISGRQPATIPEGAEPGPGSPMPRSEEIRPSTPAARE